jgi:nucleotide-binding universal stress UspA family protein
MLGSVTADVLRHTATPVAIIPPSHPEIVALAETHAIPQFDTILVPVDLESGSDRQLEMAVRLSASSRHGIVVLHVVVPGTPHDVPLARMNALVSRFATTAAVQLQVKDGSPADIIGDLVSHGDIGIAVLGRSSLDPGRVALEASRRGKAVLILVP